MPANAPRRILCPLLLLIGALCSHAAAEETADEVPVPGGPASIRRLLGLEAARPRESFFLDLHEALLAGAEWKVGWSRVERRRAVVDFAEDFESFGAEFGQSVVLSSSSDDWSRTRRVLAWLGVRVRRGGGDLATENRGDPRSLRGRAFFDAIGVPVPAVLSKLRAREEIVVRTAAETAPIPFGLAAWREMLGDSRLSAAGAFIELVKNVRASRLLVALHALDPETREGLRALAREGRSSVLLHEDVLDCLARFPGALALSGGDFVLPGGKEAEAIWADIFGVAPSKHASFLRALFEKDSGRGAYVVEVLQQLPEPVTRALLFGGTGGANAVARFRKLYRAIEKTGRAIDLSRRDPYDFAHLARFLRTDAAGRLLLPSLDLDGETFPANESELAGIVAGATQRTDAPEETLIRLLRGEAGGSSNASRAVRRFIVVSSLLEGRPLSEDPGVVALLLRGAERFSSAYALLEDSPFQEPSIARRYLFTLDRLDSRRASRESEVASALFQAGAEILAQLYRAGSLEASETESLFSAFLDLPLFSREGLSPARGEKDLFAWISRRLLPALEKGGERALAARPPRAEPVVGLPGTNDPPDSDPGGDPSSEPGKPPDESRADELLTRSLVGHPPPAVFDWGGGHYRFDPAEDDALRRSRFREKQRLASLGDVEAIHRARDALLGAASRGDSGAVRAASADLVDLVGLSSESGGVGAHEDEQILEEYERAREALADLAKTSKAATVARVEEGLARVDAVAAERLLEALLGHLYAASAGDPDDLYYEDQDFVRRHSFRTVEKGGRIVGSALSPTELTSNTTGGGSRVSGSLFGLADVLGLLHADQITYAPGSSIANENIRSGLMGPVRRMSVARLDDDALQFVAASCRATEELAAALASRERHERFRAWRELAKDLVPRSRLALLAEQDEMLSSETLARFLSPTDLYRIGRRVARDGAPESVPSLPSALAAKRALARLEERLGADGARERLAELGPRAFAWAGRQRLTDLDLPPYESLAAYRMPQLFADRLYDWKIAVARVVAEAGLPAGILPLVLPRAVDVMISELKMAFPYDWSAIVRKSAAFGPTQLARLLDEGLQAGRLLRDHTRDTEGETR
jgi:hypothetical protein